jgi:hypothetical protein
LKRAAYGGALAAFVGVSIVVTYYRYAEWYDAVSRLCIPGTPFFFGYVEGVIRGVLLGLFNTVGIFLIFMKFSDPRNCRPVWGAAWICILFSATAAFCFFTQPRAYDPGLAIELIIPGFSAVVSTWLYAGDVALDKEPPILDKDIMLKWVEFNHEETTQAITTLALVVVAGIVTAGYTSLRGLIPAQYAVQPDLVWETISLNIFDYGLVALGFALFTMAPLFIRLDILKAKLKKTQANASVPQLLTRIVEIAVAVAVPAVCAVAAASYLRRRKLSASR